MFGTHTVHQKLLGHLLYQCHVFIFFFACEQAAHVHDVSGDIALMPTERTQTTSATRNW